MSSQSTCLAIYIEVTGNLALGNYCNVIQNLAVTFNSQTKNTYEWGQGYSLTICCIAVEYHRLRVDVTCNILLNSWEYNRVSSLLGCNRLRCRVNDVKWSRNTIAGKVECCRLCTLCNIGKSNRRNAIYGNLVAIAPIEWINTICLLAELHTSLVK